MRWPMTWGSTPSRLGATLGVLMEAGQAAFGDVAFMHAALDDIRQGNARGRLLAQGAARVGEHFGVARVPVIKRQAISAYDPRVIEVTGISMMLTAQGADHTAGNLPAFECKGKSTEQLVTASLGAQVSAAAADSLGFCIFGRSVTDTNPRLIVNALNDAHGTAARRIVRQDDRARGARNGAQVQPPCRLHRPRRRTARTSSTSSRWHPPATWRAITPRKSIGAWAS